MALKYRAEIDGLRFVAVALVLLAHLDIAFFSGGFVGVDVFFVISGYLITGIVAKEIRQGTFSFGSFYQRRVIRLAPAYFLVLVATSMLAGMYMLPAELVDYSRSVIYSTLFAANFYMWNAVGGYFGAGADTIPLLHLWSLAVEEQFYLVWPTLLLIVATGRRHLLLAVIVITLVALVVSHWGALHYKAATYYLMPTRAFELLLGAVLVLLPVRWLSKVNGAVSSALVLLGLLLIGYAAVAFGDETVFPGLNALFPCVGTLLVILFSGTGEPVSRWLLSNPVSVFLGKVSYPAYLWHWPLIAFLNLQLVPLTLSVSVAVFLGTFLLAALTYLYVEKPFVALRSASWKKVVGYLFVLPAAFMIAVAVVTIHFRGFPGLVDPRLAVMVEAISTPAHQVRDGCIEGSVTSPLGRDECGLGAEKESVDALLVGDSHANHFSGLVDVLLSDAKLRGYEVTQSRTPLMLGVDFYYQQDGDWVRYGVFPERNSYIENTLLPEGFGYVILGGSFSRYMNNGMFVPQGAPFAPNLEESNQVFATSMARTLERILEQGSIPVIIKGSPYFPSDISSCALNNLRFGRAEDCRMIRSDYQEDYKRWSALLSDLKLRFPEMIIIDPAGVMCDENYCYSEMKGLPLYRDAGHLNYPGSEFVGRMYLERFENPFYRDPGKLGD